MKQKSVERQLSSPSGVFLLLVIAVFVVEVVIMELFPAMLIQLGGPLSCLVDSTILVLLLIPVLWYVIIRPLAGNDMVKRSPLVIAGTLLKVLACIFTVEFLVELLLGRLLPVGTYNDMRNVADAALTAFFCAPLLWLLLFRPMPENERAILVEFLLTPAKLLFLLMLTVFVAHLLSEPVFSFLFSQPSYSHILADSLLTCVLASPILWYLVIRPLERRAKTEETRSNAISAQVVDAIVMIDCQGRILSFNPAAETIFGYDSAEILGEPVLILFDQDVSLDQLLHRAGVDGVGTLELHGRRRDRTNMIMDVSISRIMLEGQQQFVAIMRDVTARMEAEAALRESEQRFRQIFEQSEDAIMLFKPGSCQVIDVNSPAELLFGFDRKELLERGLQSFAGPESYERLCSVINSIGGGSRPQIDNLIVVRKDGAPANASMRGKLMTIQGVGVCCCTFRDITERIRLEEESRTIQAKLIQANKMTSLGLLVSGVAHEINNPNNYIKANSQLLAGVWDDGLKILREYYEANGDFLLGGLPFSEAGSQSAEMFSGIIDGTRRIDGIVKNLKDFARQERRLTGRPLDLNQAVKSAVAMLYHEIKRHTANFQLVLNTDVPLVKGSRNQLEQVVINLVLNACQALGSKEKAVVVSTSYDVPSDQVWLVVRDDGSGMSRELIGRIMEPFFTTKLDSGGTGLGLSICQSIIKEHNGLLECESEPGKGTTFTVKLPAARSELS